MQHITIASLSTFMMPECYNLCTCSHTNIVPVGASVVEAVVEAIFIRVTVKQRRIIMSNTLVARIAQTSE